MKHILLIYIFIIGVNIQAQSDLEPQPFLDEIATQFPNVRDIALNANNDEVVFSAQSRMGDISALVTSKKINNIWSAPVVISFSGQYFDIEPFYSSDGLTLYFASNRPLNNSNTDTKDFDIWYATRSNLDAKWSKPINFGAPINTKMDEFYPIITTSKNIYFTLDNPELKQKDNIYVSEYVDGKYTTPTALSEAINSDGYEFNAFVSSDESYIIYTCYGRKEGLGSGDLYLSKKQPNGDWGIAENMGDIVNSDKMDYCPFVDESTQTLYFTSKRINVTHDSSNKLDLKELQNIFDAYSNGSSRLYRISLSKFLKNN